ncbi:MAG TPA: hypothetical protein VJW75_08490 [Candidatus Eisenbacteria bacterium]|nr:hypothetical protein [Candidatus Eisenbacteria bacterium]
MRRRFARSARVLALPILLLVPLAAAAFADTPSPARAINTKETALQRIQRSVARINQEAATPEGEAMVVDRLSNQLKVGADVLRSQHEAWAIGYGEIAMVYGFARAARKQPTTPESVVTERRMGKDWDVIAKDLGVKIDTVASRLKRQEPPKRKK